MVWHSYFYPQICIALTNYNLYCPDKLYCIYDHVWFCMSHHVWVLQSLKEAQMLEWCFLATFHCLYVSEHYSLGLKNVSRKHFCRHGCSKCLFLEEFWNFWSAEHLLVAFRQLADHVERALLPTLCAYRMVSHPVLQSRHKVWLQMEVGSFVYSLWYSIFTCIFTWELPFYY